MATKLKRSAKPASTAAQKEADELDVLHPERHLVFGDLRITVREYGHVEWLRLLPVAAPLVNAIAALLDAHRQPTYEETLAIVATHIDGLAPMIAQSADIDLATFENMKPDQGERLLMAWWGANGPFFMQRALNKVAVSRAEMRAVQEASASATAASTPPSSPTGTTATGSAATPSGS